MSDQTLSVKERLCGQTADRALVSKGDTRLRMLKRGKIIRSPVMKDTSPVVSNIKQPTVRYVAQSRDREHAQSAIPKDTEQAVEAQSIFLSPEKMAEAKKQATIREKMLRYSWRPISVPARVDLAGDTKTQGGSLNRNVGMPEDIVPVIKTKKRNVVRRRRASRASKVKPQGASIEETWSLLSEQMTSPQPAQASRAGRPGKHYVDGLVEDAEAFFVPKRNDSNQE